MVVKALRSFVSVIYTVLDLSSLYSRTVHEFKSIKWEQLSSDALAYLIPLGSPLRTPDHYVLMFGVVGIKIRGLQLRLE